MGANQLRRRYGFAGCVPRTITLVKRWNKPNCGYAARSRSVKTCERPSSSACGWGTDVISAGWPTLARPGQRRRDFPGLASGGSGRAFTPGATLQTRLRIVDSCGDVFSDPGATPGASTTFLQSIQLLMAPFPAPPNFGGLSFRETRRAKSAPLPAPPPFSQQRRRFCPRVPCASTIPPRRRVRLSVLSSNSRMAASSAAGMTCKSRCVVPRF